MNCRLGTFRFLEMNSIVRIVAVCVIVEFILFIYLLIYFFNYLSIYLFI